jgi:glutaredoxin
MDIRSLDLTPEQFSIHNCQPTAMFPTLALRNFACRITLFTRSNCKLCSDAKEVLSNVWDKRPFEYDEINVMEHSDQKWKNMYEFDTPVVSFSCASSLSMILTVL